MLLGEALTDDDVITRLVIVVVVVVVLGWFHYWYASVDAARKHIYTEFELVKAQLKR